MHLVNLRTQKIHSAGVTLHGPILIRIACDYSSANGTAEIATNVRYSLGSAWFDVPTTASTFTVRLLPCFPAAVSAAFVAVVLLFGCVFRDFSRVIPRVPLLFTSPCVLFHRRLAAAFLAVFSRCSPLILRSTFFAQLSNAHFRSFPLILRSSWGQIKDDLTGATLTTRAETPPAAPLGYTNMLLGLQQGSGFNAVQVVPLNDAPEGGVCKP